MVEISRPWGGIVTGDAGPYSDDQWEAVWRSIARAAPIPTTLGGVLRDELNELAVTGTASPVSINTGRAIAHGTWYESDAAVTIAVPTPAVSTRIDRIVLRKDWVLQTVRIFRIAGVEGGGAPALVQTDGVTWDTPLAQASITTGAVITLTEERQFIPDHRGIHYGEARMPRPYEDLASYTVVTALGGVAAAAAGHLQLTIADTTGSKVYVESGLTDDLPGIFTSFSGRGLLVFRKTVAPLANKNGHIILGQQFDAQLAVTQSYLGFEQDGTTMFAVSADGVGRERTVVAYAFDSIYIAEYVSATEVRFWVDGALVAVHRTRVPAGNSNLQIREFNTLADGVAYFPLYSDVAVILVKG